MEHRGSIPLSVAASTQPSMNIPGDFLANMPQYRYPANYQLARKYFGGRKAVEGRGRSYVLVGVVQVFIGLLCFVLALIAMSVSVNNPIFSAGMISGLIFIVTGGFGCAVGSSLSDCYAMTYLIFNIFSALASLLGIGLSAWEVNRIGSMTSVASADGYLAIKCSLVMIGCVTMLILSVYEAHDLKDTPCCGKAYDKAQDPYDD